MKGNASQLGIHARLKGYDDIVGAKVLGGPHFDSEECGLGRFARAAYERAHRPEGFIRQLAAIIHDGDRTHLLSTIRTPTLVIHGAADPLFGHDGGKTVASAVPGARLELIEDVGHDLPEPVLPYYVELIREHIARVDITR